MNRRSLTTRLLSCALACSFILPPLSFAAEPVQPRQAKARPAAPRPLDVRLGPDGELVGMVRDSAGKPRQGVEVAVFHQGHEIAATETNAEGKFAVAGLRRGEHVILAQQVESPVRLWPEGAAPPQAVESPVITAEEEVGPAYEEQIVPAQQQAYRPVQPQRPPPRRLGSRIGRVFANYPLLATTALIGAGIGAGIAIGSNNNSASP
jgi:hypothetical protein